MLRSLNNGTEIAEVSLLSSFHLPASTLDVTLLTRSAPADGFTGCGMRKRCEGRREGRREGGQADFEVSVSLIHCIRLSWTLMFPL